MKLSLVSQRAPRQADATASSEVFHEPLDLLQVIHIETRRLPADGGLVSSSHRRTTVSTAAVDTTAPAAVIPWRSPANW